MAQEDDILKIIEELKTQLNDLSQKYKALRQEKAAEVKANNQNSSSTPNTQETTTEQQPSANTTNDQTTNNTNTETATERSSQDPQATPTATSGSNIPTTLTGSVGRGGQNAEIDVRAVQQRLVRNAIQVDVDGKIGPQTQAAIERFQTARIGVASGLIEANSDTWKALMGQTVPRQEAPAQQNNANSSSGNLNERIAAATQAYRGTNTSAGPGGGNLACAWAVNNILQRAIGRKIGSNTNYVPSVESALKGQAQQIPVGQAIPGDIAVSSNTGHIGIVVRSGRILSNSSSRRAFVWESNMNYDGYYGGGSSRIYRLNG